MAANALKLFSYVCHECTHKLNRPKVARSASTYSAIHRALRKTYQDIPRPERPQRSWEGRDRQREHRIEKNRKYQARFDRRNEPFDDNSDDTEHGQLRTLRHRRPASLDREGRWRSSLSRNMPNLPDNRLVIKHEEEEDRVRYNKPIWSRLPLTTAASQFLYGHSAVLAALRTSRRKLYMLYLVSRPKTESDGEAEILPRIESLHKEALVRGVRVRLMGSEFLPMMRKASGGRKHDNCILEASPLPVLPILSLQDASRSDETFEVSVASQSKEEIAINGTQSRYSYESAGWRHPFLLYLDGITDEGNLGAILRSAYMLGVDAVILGGRGTAPLSAISGKASSGAAEAIELFMVHNSHDFFKKSSAAGWRIYAADMPADRKKAGNPEVQFKSKHEEAPENPLSEAPTILVLGNEETGVAPNLKRMAHHTVGISGARGANEIGLDSLNVSAAAALLCMDFLRGPNTPQIESKDKLF